MIHFSYYLTIFSGVFHISVCDSSITIFGFAPTLLFTYSFILAHNVMIMLLIAVKFIHALELMRDTVIHRWSATSKLIVAKSTGSRQLWAEPVSK